MSSQGYITPKMLKWGFAALAGMVLFLLFFPRFNCRHQDPDAPVITPTKEIKKNVADTEAVYKARIDSLNQVNADLQKTNQVTLDDLQTAQQRGRTLAAALKKRSKGDTTIVAGGTDEPGNGSIDEYIANSELRDTLCNKAITNLQDQVVNRDRVITQKDTLYSRIRSTLDFTLNQQDQLIKYNKDLKKQIKRKKFAAGVFKVTTIGAVVYGIIKSIK